MVVDKEELPESSLMFLLFLPLAFPSLCLVSTCQGVEDSMKDFGLLECPESKTLLNIIDGSSEHNLTLAVASLLMLCITLASGILV